MNRKGKKQLNNEAVFNLLSHAEQTPDGSYIFNDLSGQIFLVDKDGDMFTVDNNKVIYCNKGVFSQKRNGYLYVKLFVCIDGQLKKIEYAQHSIVCALFNSLSGLLDKECNHMDNCPFNNHPDNLEWTNHAMNVLHGRIVRCAKDAHHSDSKLAWAGYDLYKQTSNAKHNFDSLKVAISCQDIKAYEKYVLANNKRVKSLKQYWGLTDKNSLMSLYNYDEFIKWWSKRNNINIKEV